MTTDKETMPSLQHATKRGSLTWKIKGKFQSFEATVENRVLYCVYPRLGTREVAILLDGCEVRGEGDSSFIVERGWKPRNQEERQYSYYFTAPTRHERDEWVDAILASSKVLKEATFDVSGQLLVLVMEGMNLTPKDFYLTRANSSDPYVILRIEQDQQQSQIIIRNLNPQWHEKFEFDITQNQGVLYLLVYDANLITQDESMGQALLPLSSLPNGRTVDLWLPVIPRRAGEKVIGSIKLRVSYEYTKGAGAHKVGHIFGVNLQELGKVPKFFVSILQFLDETALDCAGIFRVSGPLSLVNEIKQDIEQGKDVNFAAYDEHSITNVLKLYLRMLPVPLLTFENYSKIIELSTLSDEQEFFQQLKTMIVTLPPVHLEMLKLLLLLLKRIGEHANENMMSPKNLGIVFGTILARPEREVSFDTIMEDSAHIAAVTAKLIEHCSEIFA